MIKSKVIIWHPFPSPSGKPRKSKLVPALGKPTTLVMAKPKTQADLDREAVARWTKLAEIALDGSKSDASRSSKKRTLTA